MATEERVSNTFERDLAAVLNTHNWDTRTDTADYMLAEFLHRVLRGLETIEIERRESMERELDAIDEDEDGDEEAD